MFVKTGTYTGTGASNPITGFGFAPVFLWIKRHGATSPSVQVIKTGGVSHSKANGANAVVNDTNITLDADGFTLVGNDATFNTNGGTYEYIAVGAEAADMAVFEYAGDTTDNRTVGSFSFTPDLVFVLPSSTVRPAWRCDQTAGDLSHDRYDRDVVANAVQALQSGSIQVGTSLNASATTYYVAVLKKVAGVLSTAEYIGDGLDDRNIAHGLTTTPTFAYVQGQTSANTNGLMRFGADVTDVAHQVVGGSDLSNRLQSIDGTNVQIGSGDEANRAAATFSLLTFADRVAAAGQPAWKRSGGVQFSGVRAPSEAGMRMW